MTPALDQFRPAISRDDANVRLPAPTMTMARHIRVRQAVGIAQRKAASE